MDPLEHVNVKKFRAGDLLFQEGDSTQFFYIIQSGKVEVFLRGVDGKKISLSTVEAGQAIGEFALITKKIRTASAQALTEVEAFQVSEEAYEKLFGDLPEWSQVLIKTLVQRLIDTTQLIKNKKDDESFLQKTSQVFSGKIK